ncbi:MAG: hypothetical protein ACPHVX_05750, partial [Flavobacteriaceae bacterium]
MKHRKLKNKELQRKSVEEVRQASKTPLIFILDNIRSLNNIGSVFRSSDAFLIKRKAASITFSGSPTKVITVLLV